MGEVSFLGSKINIFFFHETQMPNNHNTLSESEFVIYNIPPMGWLICAKEDMRSI